VQGDFVESRLATGTILQTPRQDEEEAALGKSGKERQDVNRSQTWLVGTIYNESNLTVKMQAFFISFASGVF
jgi:hypothetical protein